MSGRKGFSRKQALTVEDLAELVEIHRRLQRMHGTLNHASVQQLPLMAASATVKAAWAELSGAGWAWAYPSTAMPLDGVPAEVQARAGREAGAIPPAGILDSEGA